MSGAVPEAASPCCLGEREKERNGGAAPGNQGSLGAIIGPLPPSLPALPLASPAEVPGRGAVLRPRFGLLLSNCWMVCPTVGGACFLQYMTSQALPSSRCMRACFNCCIACPLVDA